MSSIDQKVRDVIVEQLGVDPVKVVDEANFVNDLNADSLDLVELVMKLEDAFDVEISEADMGKLTTVGSVASYIKSLQN